MVGTAELSLVRPTRRKLTQVVAEQLLTEIRSRRLAPGTRMPSERELMASMGVGRSTVREALKTLVALDVIEVRHGQGQFIGDGHKTQQVPTSLVAALEKAKSHELFEARLMVETGIAGLAAKRRSAKDIKALEALLKSHRKALDRGEDAGQFSSLFHSVLSQSARNGVLAGFVESYRSYLTSRRPRLEELAAYREWEYQEHLRLLGAVRKSDAELAAKLMQRHLEKVEDLYSQVLPLVQ